MSILRCLKFFQVILVILVCLFSLNTLSSRGYCEDDWVYVGRNNNNSYYYNNTNIKIDHNTKQIKVWVKYIYSEKGRQNVINLRIKHHKDTTNYHNLDHSLLLLYIDYNNLTSKSVYNVEYTKSGETLDSFKNPSIEWDNIIPETVTSVLLDKILEDHNIK